jgi:hypothetical protein
MDVGSLDGDRRRTRIRLYLFRLPHVSRSWRAADHAGGASGRASSPTRDAGAWKLERFRSPPMTTTGGGMCSADRARLSKSSTARAGYKPSAQNAGRSMCSSGPFGSSANRGNDILDPGGVGSLQLAPWFPGVPAREDRGNVWEPTGTEVIAQEANGASRVFS